jgi:hypothetical protein
MDVELDEWRVANAAEAMYLSSLDDKDVTRAGLEFLAVDGPEAAALPHELDLIVGMSVGPGTASGKGAEEEHGDVHVAVIGPDELVRAAPKWQVLLADAVHPADTPLWRWVTTMRTVIYAVRNLARAKTLFGKLLLIASVKDTDGNIIGLVQSP